jgi:ADP-ribosylglycohydrolase
MLSKFQGCLMGVAIGDAMGMPVETWKHAQIKQLNGGAGITGFIAPVQQRILDTANLNAGETTDDWQLTKAVAASLIRCSGRFDMLDCAMEHLAEYDKRLFGWGKGTQIALEAIKTGQRIVGRDALPAAGPGQGCGNGIVMKVAPIALAGFVRGDVEPDVWTSCKALGMITHPDIRASIAAYAVSLVLQSALSGPLSTASGLATLAKVISAIERVEAQEAISTDLISDVLKKIPENLKTAENLRLAVGCGFHALQTVGFTIGTFLRHPTDFRSGVLEAANAGGDSDTHASVVGALIGANVGLEAIPQEWRCFNPSFREALTLGRQLCFEESE